MVGLGVEKIVRKGRPIQGPYLLCRQR